MNKLSKTQVIALFLGVASAEETALSVLNGPTTPLTSEPVEVENMLVESAGGACNALGGCDTANNKCGAFQKVGADPENLCVHEFNCGSVGKIDGTPFYVACWEAVAEGETPTAPAVVDATAALASIQSFITKETVNWDSDANLLVESRVNYQRGWWIKDATTGKWVDTPKAPDNRCFLDLQCPSDSCCGYWPDAKNRRCMAKTLDKTTVDVDGITTFTASCTELVADDIVPENAQDDIAKGALATANEELEKFANLILADAKTAAGYDDDTKCDQACKDKFDADWKAQEAKALEEDNKLKAIIGYDTDACNDSCKAAFESEILKFAKATYEICAATPKAAACANAYEIRTAVETARAGDSTANPPAKNYYSGMSADERAEHEKLEDDIVAKEEAAIIAAEVQPIAGEEGSSCKEFGVLDCVVGDQCCGKSVLTSAVAAAAAGTDPTADQIRDMICISVPEGGDGIWEDKFGRSFTHTCLNAMKLASSVAAAGIAAYYM